MPATTQHTMTPGKILLVLLFLVGACISLSAQVLEVPLPTPDHSSKKASSAIRTAAVEPLDLPFWDDFSFTPGSQVLDSLWIHSTSVLVNDGTGINPPSIHVVTFDGLDSLSRPYSRDDEFAKGYGDKLISRPIRMAGADQNTTFLSFFYQWKGLGEAPDPGDFLAIEFRNNVDEWIQIQTISPNASMTANEFFQIMIRVQGAEYFHNGFQFRLRSYGRLSGPFDTWNVDYFYLNQGRSSNDLAYPDRAMTRNMTSLFNRYYAVPIAHLAEAPAFIPPTFEVNNLSATNASTFAYRQHTTFSITKDNSTTVSLRTYPDQNTEGVIAPLQRRNYMLNSALLPDFTDIDEFDAEADRIDYDISIDILAVDGIENGIDFTVNNNVTTRYRLENYYAYDDGRPENSVELTRIGNRLAYRFESIVDEPGTLIGVDVYFPTFPGSADVAIPFYVWADVDGLPSASPLLEQRLRLERTDTLASFQLLAPVPVGKSFFVGFRRDASANFRIGFDKNTDSGNELFFFANGIWQPTGLTGSLMVRPRFGDGDDLITSLPPAENPFAKNVNLYPNPTTGKFSVTIPFDNLIITNNQGQTIFHEVREKGDVYEVTMPNAAAGIYIVRILYHGHWKSEKLIVVR